MNIKIEGWVPTPLEQSLMDGTFDKQLESMPDSEYETLIADVPEDLREAQEFEDFIEELRSEIETWD